MEAIKFTCERCGANTENYVNEEENPLLTCVMCALTVRLNKAIIISRENM